MLNSLNVKFFVRVENMNSAQKRIGISLHISREIIWKELLKYIS
jgi:hypothetical protein